MKKIISILFLSLSIASYTQSKSVLAKSYYSKAEKEFEAKNYNSSLKMLDKAKEYLEGETYPKIEYLYVMNHYKLRGYAKADIFVKRFFDLNPSEDSSMYSEIVDIIADIKTKAKEKEEADIREKERLRKLKIKREKELEIKIKRDSKIRLFNNSKNYFGNGATIYEFKLSSSGKLNWYFKTDSKYQGKTYYGVRMRGYLYLKNVTNIRIEGQRIFLDLNYRGYKQQAKPPGYDWASYVTNKHPYAFTVKNSSKRREIYDALKFLITQY